MKLTIDRAKWGRSFFYEPYTGKYCAMGFLGKQCGVPDEALDDFQEGVHFTQYRGKWPSWVFSDEPEHLSPDAMRIMAYNDGPSLADDRREAMIQEIFSKYGITVEFIN